MITFKEGNLRIPKWNRKVFVVAGGTTAYKKFFPEYKLEELVMIAFKNMLEDNNLKMDPLEVKGLINFATYGEFADHFQDQLLCQAKVHDYLGLDKLSRAFGLQSAPDRPACDHLFCDQANQFTLRLCHLHFPAPFDAFFNRRAGKSVLFPDLFFTFWDESAFQAPGHSHSYSFSYSLFRRQPNFLQFNPADSFTFVHDASGNVFWQ